jgi:UDP-glucose 4-epimerase
VLDDFSTGVRTNLSESPNLTVIEGSILSRQDVRRAIAGSECVFHLAAQVSVMESAENPFESLQVNSEGTLVVLDAARRANVRRVIYSSSSARYGTAGTGASTEGDSATPISVYAAGKLAGESLMSAYSETFGLETISLVYFNVFGPRQRPDSPYAAAVPIFLSRLKAGLPVTVYGDGTQTRDFTYVSNVVDANLLAATVDYTGPRQFNVAGGESASVNQLVEEIASELGVAPDVMYAPARPGEVQHSSADIAAARKVLGYEPSVDWREGIRRTIAALIQS